MFTILHFDKSELIKHMIKDTLVGSGVKYIPASNLTDAYKEINSNKLDLIVTSMIIENSNIEDFLNYVNSSINKNTPVFIVTSSELDEGAKKILNLGVSDYIPKENLVSEISKHIDVLLYQNELLNSLKNISIAIVDDSRLDQTVTKNILIKNGINNVDCYKSGKELFVSDKQYDLYIVDAVLKEEYGKNIVMQIRRNNLYATIIVVSSLDNSKTIVGLLDSGASDFIQKPLDEGIFIAKLKCNMRATVYANKLREI